MSPSRWYTVKDRAGRWQTAGGDQVETCPECSGAAVVTVPNWRGDPQCEREVTCERCGGEGDVLTERAE